MSAVLHIINALFVNFVPQINKTFTKFVLRHFILFVFIPFIEELITPEFFLKNKCHISSGINKGCEVNFELLGIRKITHFTEVMFTFMEIILGSRNH